MAVSKKTTDVVADPVLDPVGSNEVVLSTEPVLDPVGSSIIEPILTPEGTPQESSGALSIEEIAANQAAADAAFQAANAGVEERVAKEEAIPSMTPEELQAEFGWTVGEAISVLRDALSRSGSIHLDKMSDLLDKIEQTSAL